MQVCQILLSAGDVIFLTHGCGRRLFAQAIGMEELGWLLTTASFLAFHPTDCRQHGSLFPSRQDHVRRNDIGNA